MKTRRIKITTGIPNVDSGMAKIKAAVKTAQEAVENGNKSINAAIQSYNDAITAMSAANTAIGITRASVQVYNKNPDDKKDLADKAWKELSDQVIEISNASHSLELIGFQLARIKDADNVRDLLS